MSVRCAAAVSGALLVLWLAGCAPISPLPRGRSPLRPPALSPQSLVLDIFFVRVPFGEETLNVELWDDIDEQHFSPECRKRLMSNGFRVGRAGSRIPERLSCLMALGEKPASMEPSNHLESEDLENLSQGSSVNRRHLQIQPQQRSEIIASDIYEELPVITKGQSDEISGEVFRQAQAILALNAQVESDGRVRLQLTPEVHHGRPQKRWTRGGPGVLQLDASRRRKVFESLTTEAELAPGDMILISCLPGCSGSLGHYFFSETHADKLRQKLLVIRLSQTQHDDLFCETAIHGELCRQ